MRLSRKFNANAIYSYLVSLLDAYMSEDNLYQTLKVCSDQTDHFYVKNAYKMLDTGVLEDISNPAKSVFEYIESEISKEKRALPVLPIVKQVHSSIADMELNSEIDMDELKELKNRVILFRQENSEYSGFTNKLRGGLMVATVSVCVIAVIVQGLIYFDKLKEQSLRSALSRAMSTSVNEVFVDKTTQKQDHNTLLAVFMQSLLQNVDDDVDLTVRVCEDNNSNRELEVEAIGEYKSPFNVTHKVRVRRRVAF